MSVVTVYTVFKDRAEATAAARTLVEEKLVACANLLAPCTSVYTWEGETVESEEVPMLAKTLDGKIEAVIGRLKALNSYDNPAIAVWPIIAITDAYAQWVERSVG